MSVVEVTKCPIHLAFEECMASGEFVGYHRWGDDPSIFLVGIPMEVTKGRVVFQDVNSHGKFISEPHVLTIKSIHSLDRDTDYLRTLRVLNELPEAPVPETREARKPADIRRILEDACQGRWVIALWRASKDKNDYLVRAVGEDNVTVTGVRDRVIENGLTVIRLKRIKRVVFGPAEWRTRD